MQVNALKNKLTNKVRNDIYWLYQWCRETDKSVSQRWSLSTFLNPAIVTTRFNERCMCDTQDLAQ